MHSTHACSARTHAYYGMSMVGLSRGSPIYSKAFEAIATAATVSCTSLMPTPPSMPAQCIVSTPKVSADGKVGGGGEINEPLPRASAIH